MDFNPRRLKVYQISTGLDGVIEGTLAAYWGISIVNVSTSSSSCEIPNRDLIPQYCCPEEWKRLSCKERVGKFRGLSKHLRMPKRER